MPVTPDCCAASVLAVIQSTYAPFCVQERASGSVTPRPSSHVEKSFPVHESVAAEWFAKSAECTPGHADGSWASTQAAALPATRP